MQQTYLDECNAHADTTTDYKKSQKLRKEILKSCSEIKTDYEETKKEKEEQYHELIAARELNEHKQKLLLKIKDEYWQYSVTNCKACEPLDKWLKDIMKDFHE